MKSSNIQKMPKAGQAGNGTKPNVSGSLLFSEYDLERLNDWIMDDNRKPSVTAFTSGVARNIASLIEMKLKKQ